MQLNQTYTTFDDVMEYFLPITIFKLYRTLKKIYLATRYISNVFILNLAMRFFKESNNSTDLYRKVWLKQKIRKDIKEVGSVHPFKIKVPVSVLEDLKSRLGKTRFGASLGNSNSDNVFKTEFFKRIINYWKTEFDWRKHEQELNKFPHYKIRIRNSDMHYLHFKADRKRNSEVKLIPLLLIHNWPGSFADFHKVIPILQTYCLNHGFVSEIVCPSLPGCGFSEALLEKDFSVMKVSEILMLLMDRLGYKEFYVHGNGWGAIAASLMARYYPLRVKGMHVNMCFALPNLFDSFIKTLVVSICPFFINRAEYNIIFPLKQKIRMLLEETGFLHMQCTKPETLGCAVTDSPITLAIHVLETFSLKKTSDHLQLQNGDLKETLLDDMLMLVTLLWVSNNFTNGARFLKESMSEVLQKKHNALPLTVPCGIAFFPEEIFMLPKYMLENMIEDLVSYTVMPKGGHFAAIEEPELLAKDIWKFVYLVENRFPHRDIKSK